jgi:twitching motility two-component system response regulator PilG
MLRHDLANTLRLEGRPGPLVLIADDSPTMRVVARHALERAGLQTLDVATPREVIAVVGEVFPDLFVLDITFAVGAQPDGYHLCRALRDLPAFRETPILLVSGHAGILDKARGRLAGATGYITKPFAMAELVAHVKYLADEEWRRRRRPSGRE